ncbi:hypothetical protein IWQ62_003873, partial [Dispira parvispora]
MPSVTLPSSEDKAIIKRALPSNVNKILTATVARVFVARPPATAWTYTRLVGALALVRDHTLNNTYFLRLVDMQNNRGVLWEQELYQDFELTLRQPFFYTFEGDEYMFGLDFADEGEAKQFCKKLKNRDRPKPVAATGSTPSKFSSFFGGGSPRLSGSIRRHSRAVNKSQISAPTDFKHVGHVGWDPEKGFDMENIDDPEWRKLVDQLSKYGISKEQLQDKETAQIVMGFVQKHGGVQKVVDSSGSTSNRAARTSRPSVLPPPPPTPPPPPPASVPPPPSSAPLSPTRVNGPVRTPTPTQGKPGGRRAPPPPPSRANKPRPPPPGKKPPLPLPPRSSPVNRTASASPRPPPSVPPPPPARSTTPAASRPPPPVPARIPHRTGAPPPPPPRHNHTPVTPSAPPPPPPRNVPPSLPSRQPAAPLSPPVTKGPSLPGRPNPPRSQPAPRPP